MEVFSVRGGTRTTLTISRHLFDKPGAQLGEIDFPISTAATEDKQGTTVRLIKLLEHAQKVDVSELRHFLAKEFGLTKDFAILIDGERLSSTDIKGRRRTINHLIPSIGTITGKVTIAPRNIPRPGFVVYVRGRAVEGPTLYDINTPTHHFRVANRIIGEITADFLDPDIPEKLLDSYIISTSRDGFNQSHPTYLAYKRWAEDELKNISRELEKQQTKERLSLIENNPSVQRVIRDLPRPLRRRFEESIRAIVPRLNDLSDENANKIIEFLARMAETESMLTILERLQEARDEDINELAKLLREWGIYEIASLSTLIKSRLEVIDKFETLIGDMSAKELPDIHAIVENNLWILDDNFRFYSSNQQMAKILSRELAKKFRSKTRLRPDLICRSLQDRYVVVELKRPSHKITHDDVSQLFGYANILRRHFPNSEALQCFLIGRSFDDALASREPVTQGTVTVSARSFSEAVESAKARYREILRLFEKESDKAT